MKGLGFPGKAACFMSLADGLLKRRLVLAVIRVSNSAQIHFFLLIQLTI